MYFIVSGILAEGIFADGVFAEGVFAERNFRRTELSPNGIFTERKFRRTEFSPSEFLPCGIFAEYYDILISQVNCQICAASFILNGCLKKLACVYMCIYVYKLIRPFVTLTPHYLEANRVPMQRGSSGI